MKSPRLLSALLLLACACESSQLETFSGQSRDAIIGGVVEPSHGYVVMVGNSQGGSCTGTLLSRRTVITAGHCRNGSNSLSRVFFDTGNPLVRTTITATSSLRHPQYNGALENDLSLVQLSQDAPVQAVPLLRETMTNSPAFVGPKYTFVGYGDTIGSGGGFGTRRVVTLPIMLVGPSPVTYPGVQPQGSPSAIDATEWYYRAVGKNTCFGDSGGPAFIVRNGVERHAGATSYGDNDCTYDGVQSKTDATTVAWIQQTIDLWEGATDPCKSDGVCGAGCVSTNPAPLGTMSDPDCADQHCAADGVCVLSCAVVDPDCASLSINDCAENGICNSGCVPADVDCANASGPLGTACTIGGQCLSGFCSSNNVCCDTACNGTCESCSAAGACGLRASTEVCRPAAGNCDVAESCTGTSAACPADALTAAATTCRASVGACDVAEACTGTSAACPSDAFLAASVTCRPSAGGCDLPESCSGTSAACPGDVLRPPGFFCRANSGLCDIAEACDGVTAACPADVVAANGIVCRPANGQCDIAEVCSGAPDCPPDAVAAQGVVCRAANFACDAAEVCNGNDNVCPTDVAAMNGTMCVGGTCASGQCAPTVVDAGRVAPPVDAGPTPVVDAGTVVPNPPRGCGCSSGSELFFALAALPMLVRRRFA